MSKGRVVTGGIAAILALALAVTQFVYPLEGNKLTSYQDIVQVWTVCGGVTGAAAQPGRTYTEAECDALTTSEVAKHLRGLAVCVHKPLRENEWVALGSWAYNVGVPAACRSTLVRQINAGHPPDVWCRQLLKWDYAGGKRVPGLTRRRGIEYRECIGEG